MDLIAISNKLKQEADMLLAESNLLEKLQQFGEIHFDGSYYLNVLLDSKDVDVLVYNPNLSREHAIGCVNMTNDTKLFDRVEFFDRVSYPKPNGMKGYIIQSQRDARDGWKMDIWMKDSFNTERIEYLKQLKDLLTEQKRSTILEFKEKKKLKHLQIPSYKIYEAVILRGITDFKVFVEMLPEVNEFENKYRD